MTDLVDRLRRKHGLTHDPDQLWDVISTLTKERSEAADEIERLRATLLEIAEFNSVGGDAAYMMDLARRALGEAKDE
jgi:hypothetical protein